MTDDDNVMVNRNRWSASRPPELFTNAFFFFLNDRAPPEFYPLPLPAPFPISARGVPAPSPPAFARTAGGDLTDAQIDALVQGLINTWGRPEVARDGELPPYGAPAPGDAERGKAVFVVACAACHGLDGRGGPKGGSVVDPSYLALVSDQGLRTTVIVGRPDLGMPDWRGYVRGQPLSPEHVADVTAWLVAQRRPVPGRLPTIADTPRPAR